MSVVKRLLVGIACAVMFNVAQAGEAPPPPPTETRTGGEVSKDEAFIGLEWTIGKSILPEVQVGYRDVDVESDGDVSGAQVSLTFNIEQMSFGKLRLEGVQGDEDIQGQLGVGYNFAQPGWMLTGGGQGNYVFAGVDYTIGSGFDFRGGVNTISDYDVPSETVTLSCPDNYSLKGDKCQLSN